MSRVRIVILTVCLALIVWSQGYTYRRMRVTLIWNGITYLHDFHGNSYAVFSDGLREGDYVCCWCFGYSADSLEIRDFWKEGTK